MFRNGPKTNPYIVLNYAEYCRETNAPPNINTRHLGLLPLAQAADYFLTYQTRSVAR